MRKSVLSTLSSVKWPLEEWKATQDGYVPLLGNICNIYHFPHLPSSFVSLLKRLLFLQVVFPFCFSVTYFKTNKSKLDSTPERKGTRLVFLHLAYFTKHWVCSPIHFLQMTNFVLFCGFLELCLPFFHVPLMDTTSVDSVLAVVNGAAVFLDRQVISPAHWFPLGVSPGVTWLD